jgi:hypothetical protein
MGQPQNFEEAMVLVSSVQKRSDYMEKQMVRAQSLAFEVIHKDMKNPDSDVLKAKIVELELIITHLQEKVKKLEDRNSVLAQKNSQLHSVAGLLEKIKTLKVENENI